MNISEVIKRLYFDYDKQNEQQDVRCVIECEKYFYDKICYSNCNILNNVKIIINRSRTFALLSFRYTIK